MTEEQQRKEFERGWKVTYNPTGKGMGNFYTEADMGLFVLDKEKVWHFHITTQQEAVREALADYRRNRPDVESQIEDAVEVAEKETKKRLLAEIEGKMVFVEAYSRDRPHGPLLADSVIMTMDDWLEIKSGRKSKTSYAKAKLDTELSVTQVDKHTKKLDKSLHGYVSKLSVTQKEGK